MNRKLVFILAAACALSVRAASTSDTVPQPSFGNYEKAIEFTTSGYTGSETLTNGATDTLGSLAGTTGRSSLFVLGIGPAGCQGM